MKRYSKEELLQDFKILKACICEEHPLAFTDREIPYFTRDTRLPEVCGLSEMGGNILPRENHFRGAVTLLTDGGCFSTSGHFAAVFKENHLGKILGSTTGGGAACTDFSEDAVLENTGLRLHYSRALFAVQADESMRNGVEPDGAEWSRGLL